MYIYISYFFVLVHSRLFLYAYCIHTYIRVHPWYLSRIRTAPDIACNELLHLLDFHLYPWIETNFSVSRNDFIFDIRLFALDENACGAFLYDFKFKTMLYSSCVFSSSTLGFWRKRFWYMKSNVNLPSIRALYIYISSQERSTKLHENSLVRSLLVTLTCLRGKRIGAVTPDTRVSLTHP